MPADVNKVLKTKCYKTELFVWLTAFPLISAPCSY